MKRLSSVKIEQVIGLPSEPQPNQFYLVESGGTVQLYLSDSVGETHALIGGSVGANLLIGSDVTGGGAHRLLFENALQDLAASPSLTFDGSVLDVDGNVKVFDDLYDPVTWENNLEVPTKNAIMQLIENMVVGGGGADLSAVDGGSAVSIYTVDQGIDGGSASSIYDSGQDINGGGAAD